MPDLQPAGRCHRVQSAGRLHGGDGVAVGGPCCGCPPDSARTLRACAACPDPRGKAAEGRESGGPWGGAPTG